MRLALCDPLLTTPVHSGFTPCRYDRRMNALSIASAGLGTAANRFAASAERTATGAGDLAAEVVEQVSARQEFSADVAVIRAADDMSRRLLDILA